MCCACRRRLGRCRRGFASRQRPTKLLEHRRDSPLGTSLSHHTSTRSGPGLASASWSAGAGAGAAGRKAAIKPSVKAGRRQSHSRTSTAGEIVHSGLAFRIIPVHGGNLVKQGDSPRVEHSVTTSTRGRSGRVPIPCVCESGLLHAPAVWLSLLLILRFSKCGPAPACATCDQRQFSL